MKWKWKLATVLFLTLAIFASEAWAGTEGPFFVSDTSGVDTNDGLSWATAKKTIGAALTLTDSATTNKEIHVAKGTYSPGNTTASTFTLKQGVKLYGGYPTTNTGTDTTERNWVANPTILSGDATPATPSYHVVSCVGTSGALIADARLDGFIITGGKADGFSFPDNSGGGMYNAYASPAIANCTFVGNTANSGGGMYNNESSPVITNCTFVGNTANGNGGGMYNSFSSPVVVNTIFWGNTATNGPAIFHTGNTGTLTLSNNVIAPSGAHRASGTINSSDIIRGDPKIVSVDVEGKATNDKNKVYMYIISDDTSSAIKTGLSKGTYNNVGGKTVIAPTKTNSARRARATRTAATRKSISARMNPRIRRW